MVKVTQEQVDALEGWVKNRQDAYLRKGFHLAANAGASSLIEYAIDGGLSAADQAKSIAELKREYELADQFHKDAKNLMFAGRQGG
ncbi:hypothetical protein [uncultured Sneathiella sp.]|uniref:hypothetical protein n=1 Tax=uncultured Sneathiella sp. TaxID=879315 RepID=UPI0030EF2B06|tara:strand:- start:7408 stop:7665 length:258 start_codon:yes stop_codon:yes gene_type:complete